MSGQGEMAKVPKLRFPEFKGNWEIIKFSDACELKGRIGYRGYTVKDIVAKEFGAIALSPSNIGNNGELQRKNDTYISWFKYEESPEIMVENGYILLVKTGSTYGKSALVENLREKATVNPQVVVIKPKQFDSRFLHSLMMRSDFQKKIEEAVVGGALPTLSQATVLSFTLWAPNASEQHKISHFLGAVDARCKQLRQRRDALVAYKKGVMQRIFAQDIRFTKPDGTAFPNWQEKRLAEVLTEHGERSTSKERVHSVSVHKGVIDQVEHLGRSFSAANTDHYGLVKPGDIIYTKSPTGDFPFGIIKQNRLAYNVIVSPLYGIFTPETIALGYILNEHFLSVMNTHNYLHQLVQKGAKNTLNITNTGFLQGRLKLPVDRDEQQKIADYLKALDAKIDAVAAQISAMRRFKQGLLQQMFV